MEDVNAYFRLVYDATFRELSKWCVIRAKRVQDVEDLLQNTYERFYRHIRRHGTDAVLEPRAYLYAMLQKELSRYYRFHALLRREKEEAIPLAVDVPEADALDRLTLDEIWEQVRQQPEATQKVFVLYYGHDMSIRDIAEALGMTESAVKNRLMHARSKIRIAMQKEGTA